MAKATGGIYQDAVPEPGMLERAQQVVSVGLGCKITHGTLALWLKCGEAETDCKAKQRPLQL